MTVSDFCHLVSSPERLAILRVVLRVGLVTAKEITASLGCPPWKVRPRLLDLRKAGLLVARRPARGERRGNSPMLYRVQQEVGQWLAMTEVTVQAVTRELDQAGSLGADDGDE